MTKASNAQLAALGKAIAKEESEVVRLTAAATELTAKAAELAEALADVGGPKMRKHKEAVQRLQAVRFCIYIPYATSADRDAQAVPD